MTTTNDEEQQPMTTRRTVLKWAVGGAAGLGVTGLAGKELLGADDGSGRGRGPGSGSGSGSGSGGGVARTQDRVLVVIELAGGNDGLSTFAPFESGRYRDLRPTVALGPKDVVDRGDGWGLSRHLRHLDASRLAVVQGVGVATPDLSHSEMSARWAGGTPDSSGSATGFLGRLCDRLAPADGRDGDGPLVGVSVSGGASAALRSDSAPTAALSGSDAASLLHLGDDATNAAMRRCLTRLGRAGDDERLSGPRAGAAGVLRIADFLDGLPGTDDADSDATAFARQLAFARRLIAADAGVRVLHIPMEGATFDTHEDHRATHAASMQVLGDALAPWLRSLDRAGLANRVLVATTSEFGRRAAEHAGGLDHGTASCALVHGPVRAGAVGEAPSLRRLDDDGNLRATVGMGNYYASLATWLDVDPADVLDGDPRPIDGLLAI